MTAPRFGSRHAFIRKGHGLAASLLVLLKKAPSMNADAFVTQHDFDKHNDRFEDNFGH
jgi:hypothetical protein